MRTTPKRPCKPRRVVYSADELPAICDVCDVAVYLKINPESAPWIVPVVPGSLPVMRTLS